MTIVYDTIRADSGTFQAGVVCVETEEADTQATDTVDPPPGEGLFYLVRALNDCEPGVGSLGQGVGGDERPTVVCP